MTDQRTTGGSALRLEDREALRELRARYTHTYDDGDLEGFLDLFTDDATLQLGTLGPVSGKAALRTAVAEAMGLLEFVLHFTSDEVTEFTGPDTAVGRCRFAVHVGREPSMEGAGTYEDEYRRTPAGWRFLRRTMRFAYMGPRSGGWPPAPAPAPAPGS